MPHRTRQASRTAAVAAVLVVVPVLIAGCGGDDEEPAAGPAGPVTEVTITSPDVSFDIERFEVRAGEEVTLTYVNDHDGVQHNLRIDTGEDAEPATEVAEGTVTQELVFTLAEPGEVDYLCDIHPQQMRGKVVAR